VTQKKGYLLALLVGEACRTTSDVIARVGGRSSRWVSTPRALRVPDSRMPAFAGHDSKEYFEL
jgi:hypothetical protein